MKILPIALVHQMVGNKTPIRKKRLLYKEKLYRFVCYELSTFDASKLHRQDDKAVMYLGPVNDRGKEFELHAESMPINEVKSILKDFPLVGVMSISKGTREDGEPKFVGLSSIAFVSMDDFDKAWRESLRNVVASKGKRDSQRKKLYTWEGTFFNRLKREDAGWKRTNVSKLQKIAKKILEHFKIPMNKVKIISTRTGSAARLGVTHSYRDDATSKDVNFSIVNVHDATIDTLLHELAHVVTYNMLTKNEAAGHGPEFCGVYAHILGMFSVFTEESVTKSMTTAGLKVKPYTKKTGEDVTL